MARVAALCIVLVLCLLGSVYLVTGFYYQELLDAMERETMAMAKTVEVELVDNPQIGLEDLADRLGSEFEGDAELSEMPETWTQDRNTEVALVRDHQGQVHLMVNHMFEVDGKYYELRTSSRLSTPTAMMRAFKNTYVAALTLLFLLTLGLMIYLVVRTLRPLTDLSESCAQISQGNLSDVVVRNSSDEIVSLERTFNRMVTSLREKEVVESNLRQAQRLSALGNLAAGVAHDIRNPLNSIKLLSSHTEDMVGDSAQAESAQRQLQTIRNEVDRLEEIVSSFLSLAKDRELEPEPTRVDALLEECVRLVRKDAEARNVRLATDLRCGDLQLMLDPQEWTRAILNIIINALEACPAGGRVRVFSRTMESQCEIEVRDDGPGIPKDVLEHAFDPYFTTKTTGTGLGLSITRGIVEEHGGGITITSAEDQGTQVVLTIPLDRRV